MNRLILLLLAVFTFGHSLIVAGQTPVNARADIATLVKGNNEFCLDVFARLRQTDGNIFYSPYSISTALAMTYAGAQGETAEQMAKVVHFQLPQKKLYPACAELTRELNGHGLPPDYQLSIANSLWAARDIRVRNDYQQLIKTNYGSRVRSVDFRDAADQSRELINRWVEDRTHDKIRNLLQPPDITSSTRLVLVNAIYFKAAWQRPFAPSATQKDARFEVTADKTTPVAMMHQRGYFSYLDGGSFQALELPYEGGELSFVVLLPKKKSGLAKLEESLTASKLEGWLGESKNQDVTVELPKFRTTSRLELARELSSMGMPLAFEPGAADFSGVSKQEKLSISQVIHQAFVEVDEAGTEAAAATAVGIERAAIPIEPVVCRADHPFLFLLRDRRSGSILFFGRVTDPTAGGDARGK